MKNLADFSKEEIKEENLKNTGNSTNNDNNFNNLNEKSDKNINFKKNEYEEIINKYKDKPQEELENDLMNEAERLKSEGKLSSSQLENLSNTISPFLNQQQKDLLQTLIGKLKWKLIKFQKLF